MLKLSYLLSVCCLAAATLSPASIAAEQPSHCYMRTSSGRVVNLGSLCGGSSGAVPAATQSNRPRRIVSQPDEYLVSDGKGGSVDRRTGVARDYYYQIWSKTDNSRYILKVWEYGSYPNGYPQTAPYSFRSSGEALEYFDCYYAYKSLPSCPHS